MKQTINFTQFVDAFNKAGRYGQFTYRGLETLFDYLGQYEQDTGEELELDVIGLCCEYAQNSVDELIEMYSMTPDKDLTEEELLEFVLDVINDNSIVVGYYGNQVIFARF